MSKRLAESALLLIPVVLLLALPFNVPVHTDPYRTFYSDLVAVVLLGVLFFAPLIVIRSEERRIGVLGISAFYWLIWSLWTVVGVAMHDHVYRAQWQLPLLAFGMAFLGAVGVATIKRVRPDLPLLPAIAVGIVFGAIWQSFSGFFQLTESAANMEPFFFFTNWSGRAYGNLGSANIYAHYVFWGVVASLWLLQPKWVPTKAIRLAGHAIPLWLLLAAAWGASRMLVLYSGGLLVTALYVSTKTRRGADGKTAGTVLVALFGVWLALAPNAATTLTSWVAPQDRTVEALGEAMTGRNSIAPRAIEIEKTAIVALENPLVGVGWGGYAFESFSLQRLDAYREKQENVLFTHSHNIVGQIAAEQGLVGLLLIFIGGWGIWRIIRSLDLDDLMLVLPITGAVLMHSMFEFPLWHYPFLAGWVVLLASVERKGVGVPMTWPRPLATATLLLFLGVCVQYVRTYQGDIEMNWYKAKHRDPRLALEDLRPLRQLYGLDAMAESAMMNNFSLVPEQTEERTAVTYRQARYFPAYYVQAKLVCELGMLGDRVSRDREYELIVAAYPHRKPEIDGFLKRYRC